MNGLNFDSFAQVANEIEEIDSTKKKEKSVQNLLMTANSSGKKSVKIVSHFIQGDPFPQSDTRKLGLGKRTIISALSQYSGEKEEEIEESIVDVGDIGLVGEVVTNQTQFSLGEYSNDNTLTVPDVYEKFERIAEESGSGSTSRKKDYLFTLFDKATQRSIKYILRLITGKMRIGVGKGTVRNAIGYIYAKKTGNPVSDIEKAIQVRNDYGEVAQYVFAEDKSVTSLGLTVGNPVQSMLASSSSPEDVVDTMTSSVLIERKLDGFRGQIHYDGSTVEIYTRGMEEVTEQFPDVVSEVKMNAENPVILDGEIMQDSFQDVSRRIKLETDIEEAVEELPVEFHAFDCLFADGKTLLDESAQTRHKQLEENYDGNIIQSKEIDLTQSNRERLIKTIQNNLSEVLEDGDEGLIAKNPESAYTPGKRGKAWRKIKPEVDTLDVTVIGAQWGEGDRQGVFASYELAVRDNESGELVSLGKMGTGVSDEELEMLTDMFEKDAVNGSGDEQTVTIDTDVIIEVGFGEIQDSTEYDSGYSLRFPRFLRVRDNLTQKDLDTLSRVKQLKKIS